jgi:hypothetical protein
LTPHRVNGRGGGAVETANREGAHPLIHIPGPYLIGRGSSGVIGNLGFRVRLVRGGDALLAFACTIRLILSISRRFSLFILGLDSTLFHVQDVAFLGFLWRVTLINSCYVRAFSCFVGSFSLLCGHYPGSEGAVLFYDWLVCYSYEGEPCCSDKAVAL